jgi:hypothetical protein
MDLGVLKSYSLVICCTYTMHARPYNSAPNHHKLALVDSSSRFTTNILRKTTLVSQVPFAWFSET